MPFDKKSNPGMTNTASGYSKLERVQHTLNTGEHVTVHDVLDDTEGLAAMDTLPFERGTRNLDIGGGASDEPTRHILRFYGVTNLVYDPYRRSPEHNQNILNEVKKRPVDSITSNGVLNVIIDKEKRIEHIRLAHESLKPEGVAFFKIWRGDNRGIPVGYQLNREAKYFVEEVNLLFGEENVSHIKDDVGNTIFAYKRKI